MAHTGFAQRIPQLPTNTLYDRSQLLDACPLGRVVLDGYQATHKQANEANEPMAPRPLAGAPVHKAGHRDYTIDVPTYHYYPCCGHEIRYHVPITHGEYGYCQECRDYFIFDFSVAEVIPLYPNRRRHYSPDEIARLLDFAIMRNRIADLMVDIGPGITRDSEDIIMGLTGASHWLVREVQRDLGYECDETYTKEMCAA